MIGSWECQIMEKKVKKKEEKEHYRKLRAKKIPRKRVGKMLKDFP